MKANPGKYLLVISKDGTDPIKAGNKRTANKNWILMNMPNHCKKASQKINALLRVASNMNFEQRQLIFLTAGLFGYSMVES